MTGGGRFRRPGNETVGFKWELEIRRHCEIINTTSALDQRRLTGAEVG